jgi:transcriptional regulator with XRE-family HTH domain
MADLPSGRYHEWTRGDRLRIARESVASSQERFAELARISRGTVHRYEANLSRKQLVIEQWARVTGFDYEWLMWGKIPADATSDTGTVIQGYFSSCPFRTLAGAR